MIQKYILMMAFSIVILGHDRQFAAADIKRNPTGVNVSSTRPTSLSIRFADNQGKLFTTTEALFCTRLQSNGACETGTILGRLPRNLDRGSTTAGQSAITDIMTIPLSVTRSAVMQARQGNFSDFFYVRRFTPLNGADIGAGPGNDVFVSVTCRLSAGSSRSPLSFSRIQILGMDQKDSVGNKIINLDAQNLTSGKIIARLEYTGRGLLQGWWEVRRPGDPQIRPIDLLPEAALSQEERSKQNRFYRIKQFNVTLPNSGSYILKGPRYKDLPSDLGGAYQLLLRLKASRDRESLSNIDLATAPTAPPPLTDSGPVTSPSLSGAAEPQLSFSGAIAAFPIFPLEYRVPAMLSGYFLQNLEARLLTDGQRFRLTWKSIDDSRLIIRLVLKTAQTSQTYYMPANNHISYLPMQWAKGEKLTQATISILGPDNRPVDKEMPLDIITQTPD